MSRSEGTPSWRGGDGIAERISFGLNKKNMFLSYRSSSIRLVRYFHGIISVWGNCVSVHYPLLLASSLFKMAAMANRVLSPRLVVGMEKKGRIHIFSLSLSGSSGNWTQRLGLEHLPLERHCSLRKSWFFPEVLLNLLFDWSHWSRLSSMGTFTWNLGMQPFSWVSCSPE
jgi:hypothetical protein